ncbi:MAG: hypothetical protein H6706_20980 [Myxococcales bacterium]|nr:hypothetical protein [Myxococcales bacterium]
MRFAWFGLVTCLLAPALAAEPAAPASAPKATHAPPPFTAQALAASYRPGRTWRFAISTADGPRYEAITYRERTADGVVLESQDVDADGKPRGEPRRQPMAWTALEAHAHWPAAATTRTEEPTKTPYGAHRALRYTIQTDHAVTRAWFDPALPGPPIRYEQAACPDAARCPATIRMELVAFSPGEG